MAPTTLQVLKMKVMAYKDLLDSQPKKEKQASVSYSFAERFNALLQELRTAAPELGSHLPAPIAIVDTGYGMMQVQPTEFIQVEILIRQIIGLIELHEDHK